MGIPVLVLGESGTGKSTSLRNFTKEEIGILNVAGKPLPFRHKLPVINNPTYADVCKALARKQFKAYVIDDSQYLIAFELFSKASDKGYGKFTEIAVHFYELLRFIIDKLPVDCIVYLLHHAETTTNGRTKAKTAGQMLDNQLTVEGLFSIVLLAKTDGQRYYFETQTDGMTSAKSPMEMFPREIDNDLKAVDTAIREYWNLLPSAKEEPPAELNGLQEDAVNF